MQLGRHQLHASTHPAISSIDFADGDQLFSVTHEEGYSVWKTNPVRCLRQKAIKGTLERVLVLPEAPLLALQGGGASPLYPPNKVIIHHDGLDIALAELEFGEKVCNIKCRPGSLIVVLPRSTVWFDYGVDDGGQPNSEGLFWIERRIVWQTEQNRRGLAALSCEDHRTTLALPGRQTGHCQLLSVISQVAAGQTRHRTITSQSAGLRVPILVAHSHGLAALALDSAGHHLVTASTRGTLLRLWDVRQGRMLRELRRGADQADIWGVRFRGAREDGRGDELVCWSDKGTVHVWPVERSAQRAPSRTSGQGSQSSLVSKGGKAVAKLVKANVPLPNYFSAEASHKQYTLPAAAHRQPGDVESGRDNIWHERFVLTWLQPTTVPYATTKTADVGTEMVLITHSGGWYRLRFPHSGPGGTQGDDDPGDASCIVVEHRNLWRLAEA